MAHLVFHLFGAPRMLVGEAPVEVDTRKATALLAYLAVSGGTHQRDSLAGLLWPEYDQTSARAALRRTLSVLNRAIEDEQGGSLLEITREHLGVKPSADLWMDVSAFRQHAAEPAHHPHHVDEICAGCLQALQAAAELYTEPFMAGFNLRDSANFEEWQFFQEETLRRELALVLEKLVFGLGECGRTEEAILYARRWLALDPLQEEAHRWLMMLYARSGQRNAALRQYRECVRILDQELGVAPLEETTHLYEAILNREIPKTAQRFRFVEIQPASAPVKTAAARPEAAPQPAPQVDENAKPALVTPKPAGPVRLIGRQVEWQRLLRAYNENGQAGQLVALVGEAGIGKTHLAEAFLASIREQGARIIQARCYAGESGLAYAPFVAGLSAALAQPGAAERIRALPAETLLEAARLLPEMRSLLPGGVETAGAETRAGEDGLQTRFFESLRQMILALLGGDAPGVLWIDDLHWADTATLDLLTYLARRLRGAGRGLFLLAAWQPSADETVQRLDRLTGDLARDHAALVMQLKRWGRADVVDLVRTVPGAQDQAAGLGQRLYVESEGLPFVAVEYLNAFTQDSAAAQNTWAMPASVRDLLRSRLSGLDAAALQLLSAAAVIGRSFDFPTLREASGRSELETVDGLENLLATGLVIEETGEPAGGREIRYDFTYEKLRALVYEETSQARRRLLHRRIADALARSQPQRVELPGLVAYHYEQAGQDREAAEYHLLAGEQARALFANVEALAHYQAALVAGHPDAASIHEAIGDLRTLRGDYAAAIHSFETAAALCSPGCLANLEHKLGNVHQRMGSWDLAESHYQASLEALGEPSGESLDVPFQVHLFADRGLVAHASGDETKAQTLALKALELAQSCGERYALAQAHNMLGVLARARGETDQALIYLKESLAHAEALDDPLARIAALNNLALAYGEYGDLAGAIHMAEQALDLCQKRGDRHREAALHNNLADLLHNAGREEDAMRQLKQAVVIFAEIGGESEPMLPDRSPAEIWKLTEW